MIEIQSIFPPHKEKPDLRHYFCSSSDYGCWEGNINTETDEDINDIREAEDGDYEY